MREELLKIASRLETQGALGLPRAIDSLRALAERAPAGEPVDAVREWLRKSGCPDHLLDEVARNYAAPPSQPVALCPCKDRPADQCPGEWEPGCDLGANEKFAVPSDSEPPAKRSNPEIHQHCRRSAGGGDT